MNQIRESNCCLVGHNPSISMVNELLASSGVSHAENGAATSRNVRGRGGSAYDTVPLVAAISVLVSRDVFGRAGSRESGKCQCEAPNRH